MKYSVNLFGIYELHHTRFEVTDRSLHSDWVMGTEGVHPGDELVEEKNFYGNLFFPYKVIEDVSVQYEHRSGNKTEMRTLNSIINHKPSQCNFWHYEIWWRNDLGFMIEDFSNGPQRSAIGAIRAYLKDIANEMPSVSPHLIPESSYVN